MTSPSRKQPSQSRCASCLAASVILLFAGCGKYGHSPRPASAPEHTLVDLDGVKVAMSDGEKKIYDALHAETTLDFTDEPLAEVARHVAQRHGIAVLVHQSLQTQGDDPIRVTHYEYDVPLRSALKIMLEPLDARYTIRNDMLYLCSSAEAEDHPIWRIYYVKDLVDPSPVFGFLRLSPLLGFIGGCGTPWVSGVTSSAPLPKRPHQPPPKDFERLITLIMEKVTFTNWDRNGPGPIRVLPERYCLAVPQTEEGHEQIMHLLRSLRASTQR